jgi:hypothetical protein
MPWDFVGYIIFGSAVVVVSGAAVVAGFVWAGRKVKASQRWRAREARRYGYPSDADELAQGLDRLIAAVRIDDRDRCAS